MTRAARPWPPAQYLLVFVAVLVPMLLALRWFEVPNPWWRWIATTAAAISIATGIERWWRR